MLTATVMTSDERAVDLAGTQIYWGNAPTVREVAEGVDVQALRDLFAEAVQRAGWADNAGQLVIRDAAARAAYHYAYKLLWPTVGLMTERALQQFVASLIERRSIDEYHMDEAAAGLL